MKIIVDQYNVLLGHNTGGRDLECQWISHDTFIFWRTVTSSISETDKININCYGWPLWHERKMTSEENELLKQMDRSDEGCRVKESVWGSDEGWYVREDR